MFSFFTDEPSARVWGSLRDGVFEGVIDSTSGGTYYVEQAHKYFPRHNSTRAGFHSIIYHDSDVHDPYVDVREGHSTGCGMTDDVKNWMENIQYSAAEDREIENKMENCINNYGQDDIHYLPPEYKAMADNLALHRAGHRLQSVKEQYDKIAQQLKKDFHNKYSAESNSNRIKRSSLLGVGADNKGTCTLSIQTDPMLWHHLHDKVRTA